MTRRRPQISIALFPFLAVLVCAMGALILLLLVMTRKIHHEQHDEEAPPAVVVAPVVVFPDRSLEIAELETERDALSQHVAELQQQVGELEQSVDDKQSEVDSLRQQFTKLQTTLRAIGPAPDKSDLTNLKSRISNLRSQQVVLRERLNEHEKLLLAKQLRLKTLTEVTAAAELKLQKVNSSIVALRQQVQMAQDAVTAVGTDTVVEFTNTAGTTRTPIIVEVTKDGYSILPAGIKIQKKDMDGFPANDTPLMAAILAVHRERAKHSVTSQPYVLLLVRPLGSEAFYPAQGILVNERVHFGYELIDAEKQIAAGDSAPSEAAAAEAAIADANRRREKIYANLRFLAQGMPQQGSPTPPDPTRRGLSIGADGSVRSESRSLTQQPRSRNFAGGVAPPPGFYERREAAMAAEVAALQQQQQQQQNRGGSEITGSPSETVADQFAGHFAEITANADAVTGSTNDKTEPADATPAPEYASNNRTESMLFANARQPMVPELAPTKASDPVGETAITAEEQFAAMMSGPPSNGTQSSAAAHLHVPAKGDRPGTPSFAGEQPNITPASPILDVSRVDKDLLSRLPTTKNTSKVYSTPVGITVFLDRQHMTVGQQPAIPVTADSLNAALTELLRSVDIEVTDAKKTPREQMLPVVKFIVSPGGERWRIPLAGSLTQLGIPNVGIYELSPHIETTSEAGRASL